MTKKEYETGQMCDCGGDLEEIEQTPNLENQSTTFIMQCNDCKKKYQITSVYYIEEVKE
jgi:hypothetical protein